MENVYSLIFFTERNIQEIATELQIQGEKGVGAVGMPSLESFRKFAEYGIHAYCIIFPCGSHQ